MHDASVISVIERDFSVGEVPGVLWLPAPGTAAAPLILMGHGGGLHKRSPGLAARARHAAARGFAVAAIDAPGHGGRPRSAADQRQVDAMLRARAAGQPIRPIVADYNASLARRAVPEWRAALDHLQALPEIGRTPVGYSGMTLASAIGLPLAAAEPRIAAAVFGGIFAYDAVIEAARRITIPVEVLLPWDDREIDRQSGLDLFDALASKDKTLRAKPGGHHQWPADDADVSAAFFARHLVPPRLPRGDPEEAQSRQPDTSRLPELQPISTLAPVTYVNVSCVLPEDITNAPRAVRARGLTKTFGDVVALDGVDLDVAAGQVHGVVGPNGAGKTTLFGLLLGLAATDGGTLEILGEQAGRGRPAPDGVAGFVDGPGLYPALTARGNLAALAALRGPVAPAGIDAALHQVGLTDVADDRVRGFSLGMRQRLGLAAALLTRPRLLVLDEPANGLDPAGKKHVHDTLAALAADGTAVVLSSHRMDDLAAMCSEVTILSVGRVVFSGPLGKLAAGNRALDYRLRTSDPAAAREVAACVGAVTVIDATADPETLVIRASVPALDELVPRLVRAGLAVRELAPVVSPLETAFLALTADPQEPS